MLERCLHSLRLQEHADFEVIVTDDSPDDSVADLVRDFRAGFPIRYEKIPPPSVPPKIGTPPSPSRKANM
ncbi:glycosyltransferase family A protein [Chitinophaga caseinilytica]|uniref:Glycosyltransferase family A protein n=1 Tax=Chitinophaga caseinilytica TaxID=2267521 RepID=A0ABZ2Z0U8_9BACT